MKQIFRAFALLCLVLIPACRPAAMDTDAWRPVLDVNLSVEPGSVLDFSSLVTPGPAGRFGRVTTTPDGHVAFEDAPGVPRRFFCASQPYGIEGGFPDHATADRYARQLRMHGYNLARFHFLENVLMQGRTQDFDFDPVQLDQLHYFMAALKREGIYWLMDALTSWNGAYGDVGPNRWAKKRNVKLGVYFDSEDQAHWKRLVMKLLTTPNPYTKLSPLQDPALFGIILVNEGGLNYLVNQDSSDRVNQEFTAWLVQQYGSNESLAKVWGKSPSGSTDKIEIPRRVWNASPRMKDVQRFYYEKQTKTLEWMTQFLRDQGYKGLLTSFDNIPNLQDEATRSHLEWVDMHAYHDEPKGFVSPGATNTQLSSLPTALGYIRDLSISRYWGKPFTVSEYDQPFWNKWRFEAGLAMGAYAGLQNWDMICRHGSGPVELSYGISGSDRRKAIYPFGIGMDPVARLGETLAALLYLRGDVKPAKHEIDVNLTDEYVFDQQAGVGKLNDNISKIGLITGLGMSWAAKTQQEDLAKFDLTILPSDTERTQTSKVLGKITKTLGLETGSWDKRLADLKAAGILPHDNSTDAAAGIYQSDTGQIILDTQRQTLSVDTEKTQAMAFGNTLPKPTASLTVLDASAPALVLAASMDGEALEKSQRILFAMAADARNSEMKFRDADERVLDKLGNLPVKVKIFQSRVRIKHQNNDNLHLYALHLDGSRAGEVNMTKSKYSVEIDTRLINENMAGSSYFEITSN